jgi:hypothetical protein
VKDELEDLERRFEGRAVLDTLLAEAGSLADSADVAQAFADAHRDGVPPAVVVSALWEDEPRFASQKTARKLYGNLLGLYDLVASGATLNLEADAGTSKPPRVKKERVEPPPPLEGEPDEDFVEAAWRYLDDHPKEHEKRVHRFDNVQDALVGFLDERGLSDQAFGIARHLLAEIHAMLELGGKKVPPLDADALPKKPGAVPPALEHWVDEGLDALPEKEAEAARPVILKCVAGLWASVS